MDNGQHGRPGGRSTVGTDSLLREAIDSLDCSYSLFDPDRRLIDYNRAYFELHRATLEIVGQVLPVAGLTTPDVFYDDLMMGAIRCSLPEATIDETETELQRRIAFHEGNSDNQDFERIYPGDRWMRIAKRRLAGGHVAGIALDITNLKHREIAIAASEARYRALLDSSPVGIWHIDESGDTLFGNARLAALYGGEVPASLSAASLDRVDTQTGQGPFGFPPGKEAEALITGSARRPRANVLVCASGWFSHGLDGRRGAILTLLDITPLKAAQNRAEHLAWHDPLTDLANRAHFRHALDAAIAGGKPVALMMIDLDRFKEANDRFGHAAGDTVLCEAALRLRAAAAPDDLVCRLGGDEFAILLRGPGAVDRAAGLAPELVGTLHRPARVGSLDIAMSASVGFASWPADASDAAGLQRMADLALYGAKNGGRGRAFRFETALLAARERSAHITAELTRAIERGQLELFWQPQVLVPCQDLWGVEALVRWPDSPFGGRLALPGEFLPVAHEAGLMPALDTWVIDAALRQAREWSGQPGAPARIAVNVSAGSLADRTLPSRIAGSLLRYGLAPSVLLVEVPESLANRDLDDVAPVLAELAEMGIGLALDDFGGGLSSLSHLVRLPVSLLKLDRSIVAGLPGERERTLLRAVMALAEGLSIPVLAEGIETEAQAFALRREGCTLMQGYLFGRPVAADALVPLQLQAAEQA